MIKILITDDHAIVRMGLVALFDTQPDFQTVGEAADGKEAVAKTAKLHPDVVLMDIMMPNLGGIDATAKICAKYPETKVLCLTTSTSPDEHYQALEAGAMGIITKSDDKQLLVEAIRKVAADEKFISSISEGIMAGGIHTCKLTDRQAEILTLVAKGMTNKQIATQLGCHIDTIQEHITAARKKLGACCRADAAIIAMKHHLLKI